VFSEVIAKNHIAVPQQVARDLIQRKCIPRLLSRPLGGRVAGHIEVKNTATIMGQDQKDLKDVETDGGNREEIDRDQSREVVLHEGAPRLRRRFTAAHHVFADTGLADVDAEFEQLAVNARCTPAWILPAHLADQISGLAGNDGSSESSASNPPSPKQAKALAMPGHDRLGPDDDQHRTPIAPQARQADPKWAVA